MGLTQDEVAEMLSVSPKSVSKWERGDTYPDITLLPVLANLFKTSIDSLVGMDKINDAEARSAIFKAEHECQQVGELREAARILDDARKTFPNDVSLLSEHALVLSLFPDPETLKKSVAFCEQVLAGSPTEKVRHTISAAVCFIYLKLGETQKAQASAQNLRRNRFDQISRYRSWLALYKSREVCEIFHFYFEIHLPTLIIFEIVQNSL